MQKFESSRLSKSQISAPFEPELLVAERAPKARKDEKITKFEFGTTCVGPKDAIPPDLDAVSPDMVYSVVEGSNALFYRFREFHLPDNRK